MAATTAGALKAHIESLGLGLAAYRRKAPDDAGMRYVVIHEGITKTPRQHGDFGSLSARHTVTEEVQVDLYQHLVDTDGTTVAESYTLPDELVAKLHGAHLAAAPTHVYGCRVLNATDFPDDDTNVVRHLITLALDRALQPT